jgi:hypothetical protein
MKIGSVSASWSLRSSVSAVMPQLHRLRVRVLARRGSELRRSGRDLWPPGWGPVALSGRPIDAHPENVRQARTGRGVEEGS